MIYEIKEFKTGKRLAVVSVAENCTIDAVMNALRNGQCAVKQQKAAAPEPATEAAIADPVEAAPESSDTPRVSLKKRR